jgi:hypothetical protein
MIGARRDEKRGRRFGLNLCVKRAGDRDGSVVPSGRVGVQHVWCGVGARAQAKAWGIRFSQFLDVQEDNSEGRKEFTRECVHGRRRTSNNKGTTGQDQQARLFDGLSFAFSIPFY